MKDASGKAPAERTRTALMLIVQLYLLISTAAIAVPGILYGTDSSGTLLIGWGYFRPFTMDCNVLAGIAALVTVFFSAKSLLKKENAMPAWAAVLRFTAAVCLLLTLIMVVFFIMPMDALRGRSLFRMLNRELVLFHLVNPLAEVLSFLFLTDDRLSRRDCAKGVVPTAAYIVVYFLMVIVFRRWQDFYGFTFGGKYFLIPIVIIVILLLTWLLGYLLIRLNRRIAAKQAEGGKGSI